MSNVSMHGGMGDIGYDNRVHYWERALSKINGPEGIDLEVMFDEHGV